MLGLETSCYSLTMGGGGNNSKNICLKIRQKNIDKGIAGNEHYGTGNEQSYAIKLINNIYNFCNYVEKIYVTENF